MRERSAAAATLALAALLLAFAPAASAEAPPPLWKKGQNCGVLADIVAGLCGFKAFEAESGLKLVETTIPRGIAADPETGHLYIADQQNSRVVELTAWGDFVKAWAWGVKDGSSEPQTCTAETGCLTGKAGQGKGQFAFESAGGVAIDSSGGIYVVDIQNHRIQKFDREGDFIWMVGGDVNKTKVEALAPEAQRNLCPVDPGDECQKGTTGTVSGQFEEWPFASFVAVGPGDTVYVGDKGRIQLFEANGAFKGTFPDPEGILTGKLVRSLAVDPSGNAYLGLQEQKVIRKLNPTGTVACTASFEPTEAVFGLGLQAVAVSPNGGFYVTNDPSAANGTPNLRPRIIEFDSTCKRLEPVAGFGNEDEGGGAGKGPFTESTAIATGSACYSQGFGLYVTNFEFENSFIRAYGAPPDPSICPPPEVAPSIDAQYAASVDDDGAILKAQIDPHFWEDTTYYLEYGTEPCSEGGCAKQPAPPGLTLPGANVEEDITTAGVFLKGLTPHTTYHYRFVAESSGGGPVIGVGGTETEVGEEASFTTFPAPEAPNTACANQALRTGASAALPDCRAYEMVSPVDKAGGDVNARTANFGFARINQASLTGDRITYSSYRAFADPLSAPFTSQYLAERDPKAGWQSESISPPQEGVEFIGLIQIESLFKAFSPELDHGWTVTNTEPVLGPGGQPGLPDIYRRDNEAGGYEGCTSASPAGPVEAAPDPQGASTDHDRMAFRSHGDLTEDSAPGNKLELYLCSFPEGGGAASVNLVSVLPDQTASDLENQAGSPSQGPYGQDRGHAAILSGAVSEDASRIFWTAGPGDLPGTLYLRLNPTEPESPRLNGAATGKGDLIGPALATGKTAFNKAEVSEVKLKSGKFTVGQKVSALAPNEGTIPAGATIEAIEETAPGVFKLTLSAKASSGKTVELSGAASEAVSNVSTESGEFAVGQEISGQGIPGGTTILSISPGSLTLSAKATQTKAGAALSATSPCTEALTKACTIDVSRTVSGEPARFWGATPSGSESLFEAGAVNTSKGVNLGDLYLFDTAKAIAGEAPDTLVAQKSNGVLGFSADLSRIYFVSEEALAEGATAGQPNLYLYEGGEAPSTSFIATLAKVDIANGASVAIRVPSPVNERPDKHAARVTPDGETLAFMSSSVALAEEAGYDNTDQISGEPDAEVYRYEAETGELACVSCNRTGARPTGRELGNGSSTNDPLWAAARLRAWENSLDPLHPLSEDGRRIFFESFEALILADTNGKADVYQWEGAGSGDCDAKDAAYVEASNGCVSLISSGKSPTDAEFIDASIDGRDAFFTTAASLLPQDPGSIDIYDARAGGGFLAPPPAPVECEGQACQAPSSAPNDPSPASAAFSGAGNVSEPAKPRCRKGKLKRRGRCVAKKKRKSQRQKKRGGRHGA